MENPGRSDTEIGIICKKEEDRLTAALRKAFENYAQGFSVG